MDTKEFTIKQLEQLFSDGNPSEELIEACRQDSRQAAGRSEERSCRERV